MEEDYISISTLNDFIFCPYSMYLHNVYMESDEGLYHATPQTRGRNAHETVDTKKASNRTDDLQSLPVIKDDKIRTRFAKMLRSQGAIRLQFSVYEVNNTQRVIDNIKVNIVDKFSKLFTGADSVLIFDAPNAKVEKFGNAIHRDKDVVYL
jgi:CRISPR-associated protein Cas2